MTDREGFTTVVLPESRRGRNKRGIAAHKPARSYTRKAKRQNTASLGLSPQPVTAYAFRADRI